MTADTQILSLDAALLTMRLGGKFATGHGGVSANMDRYGRPGALHYLEANRVENMNGVEVCTGTDQKLGAIDGIVIERDTRRLKYFVVEPEASHERCLLAADKPAVFKPEERKLMVDATPGDLEHLDAHTSDDDLVEAIRRHPAA